MRRSQGAYVELSILADSKIQSDLILCANNVVNSQY